MRSLLTVFLVLARGGCRYATKVTIAEGAAQAVSLKVILPKPH